MIHVAQIRAARAMLNLSQKQLAKKAGVAIATVNNIERGAQTDPKISTLKCIQQALEREGVEFNTDPQGNIGVMLHQRTSLKKGENVILIVDDNKADRLLYRTWLSQLPDKNYRILEAENVRTGYDAFMAHAPQCLILDFMMYGADGFQLLAAIRRANVKMPPILFITSMHHDALEKNAQANGVFRYLNKQKLSGDLLRQNVEQSLN